VVAATCVGLVGFDVPRTIPQSLERASEGGAVLLAARHRMPAAQQYVWYLGDVIQEPYWIAYPFDRPAARLVNLRAVDELAASAPDDLVLVDVDRLTPDLLPALASPPCRAGVPAGRNFEVATARALDAALRTGPCPAVSAASVPRTTAPALGPVPVYAVP
jgi:hypothetical protein